MQLPLASTEMVWGHSPRAPQLETGSSRCAGASRLRRFDSCIPSRAPLPLPASRESDLFPPSPQAACWRWNEILAAWGKLGRAVHDCCYFRAVMERARDTTLLSAATPTPAASWELMGVSTAVKNYSARARARPSPGGARAPVIGGWFATHTHVPLFGRTGALFAQQHVVPLEKSNQHWKFKEQPSSAGRRLGEARVKWWGRRQARLTPGEKAWGWRAKRLLWEKGTAGGRVDSDDDNNLLYLKELF